VFRPTDFDPDCSLDRIGYDPNIWACFSRNHVCPDCNGRRVDDYRLDSTIASDSPVIAVLVLSRVRLVACVALALTRVT